MGADAGLYVNVALEVGALSLRAQLHSTSRRLAIVGPSGAGKSTLLRIVAGLERRVRGEVRFAGQTWHCGGRASIPAHRRRVGWVPQDARLFPHRTVAQNLCFAGASKDEALRLASRFGIDGLLTRRPRHLSGGESQRVALARALLARPRLLLLDEPFAALDRARRIDLAALLLETLAAEDVTLVLVTHDERDVASLADEVYEMSEGELPAGSIRAPLT